MGPRNAEKAEGTRWYCGNRRRVNTLQRKITGTGTDMTVEAVTACLEAAPRVTAWRPDVATSAEYSLACDSDRGAVSETRRSTDIFDEFRYLQMSTFYIVYTHIRFIHNQFVYIFRRRHTTSSAYFKVNMG